MTVETFRHTVSDEVPPAGLSAPLRALWHDASGDWQAAHDAVQDEGSTEAAVVHAYLHRKEGDLGNAAYWYRRAGRPVSESSLDQEWEHLVRALL